MCGEITALLLHALSVVLLGLEESRREDVSNQHTVYPKIHIHPNKHNPCKQTTASEA
jgi:hypothetical protein